MENNNIPSSASQAAPDTQRISTLLDTFLKSIQGERISIQNLVDAMGDRAFGMLLLIFALPNLISTALPGISFILGLPLLFLSYQLLIGLKQPWFPKFLSQRTFRREDLRKLLTASMPFLKKVESLLQTRLSFLLAPIAERIMALICLIMAILITLPIPLGNWFPALAISFFAIALLEHDGLCAILGYICAIIGVCLVGTLAFTALKAILFFL